ncbi:MAG: hypothetical protein A3F72_21645 [Bacteroidetes bacterium RIFCSPLOWO2_12_FULL_35_15]|nr:MAG: hypothetical protein A3F72_21645 [Bacteroidetes bacterium RIFCSPLOWO2_12_FULL_35_15]
MIPKIIHYCWFGGKEEPKEYQQYIKEWKELNPGYKIIRWDESNSPMDISYLKKAYKNKKWANMSNLVRFYALIKHGGFYLDTDIKLIKPLDIFLKEKCFLGFEEGGENESDVFWVNNAVIGAVKNHSFIKKCFDTIIKKYEGVEEANLSAPRIVTQILKDQWGLTKYGYQKLKNITLFPSSYFYPIHYSECYKINEFEKYIDDTTVAVHMWGRSWLTQSELLKMYDELLFDYKTTTLKTQQYVSELKNAGTEITNLKIESDRSKKELLNKMDVLKSIQEKTALDEQQMTENAKKLNNNNTLLKEELENKNEQITKMENILREKIAGFENKEKELNLQLIGLLEKENLLIKELDSERNKLNEIETGLTDKIRSLVEKEELLIKALADEKIRIQEGENRLTTKLNSSIERELALEKVLEIEKDNSSKIETKLTAEINLLIEKEELLVKSLGEEKVKFREIEKALTIKINSLKESELLVNGLLENEKLKFNKLQVEFNSISNALDSERIRLQEKELNFRKLDIQLKNAEYFYNRQLFIFEDTNTALKKSIETKDRIVEEQIRESQKKLAAEIKIQESLKAIIGIKANEFSKLDQKVKELEKAKLDLDKKYFEEKIINERLEDDIIGIRKEYDVEKSKTDVLGRKVISLEREYGREKSIKEGLLQKIVETDNDIFVEKNKIREIQQALENKENELRYEREKINKLEQKLEVKEEEIAWYRRTFLDRKLTGIIKDRILKIEVPRVDIYKPLKKTVPLFRKFFEREKVVNAKIKTEAGKKIMCSIVNYNCNENALKLRSSLSKYFDTVVFDSGSKIKNKKFIQLDNVYYSGLFNNAYEYARSHGYEYVFFICSDVEIKNDQVEIMVNNLNNIDISEIGIYSPSSTGRSHFYCKKQNARGLRVVPFVEGFVFLAHLDVLKNIAPIDLNINKYGWGLDVAKGFFAKKLNKLCVIDDEVTVYHPEGTGYSDEFAEEGMWKWMDTFEDVNFKNFYTKQIDIIRKDLAGKNKIAIIIPCYNQVAYIKETVYSILYQEYSNFEILLINDGSTDNTEELAKELCLKFNQVKYLPKKNGGLGNTRNFGLEKHSGDYVQFLDSDDIISKNKFLNQIYDFIVDPTLQVSYSEYICFEDGNKEKTWTYSRLVMHEDPVLDLIQNWETELSIPVHCFLFNANILKKERFDEELPNHEDWEFHLKIASHKPNYKYQQDAIAYYRVRTTSMSRDRELMIKGKKMCIKKAIDSKRFSGIYLEELKKRYNEK